MNIGPRSVMEEGSEEVRRCKLVVGGGGKVCCRSGLVTKSSRVERQSELNDILYQPDRGRGIGYGRA